MAEDERFPTYDQLEEGWKQMQAERDRLRAALLMMKHAYETDNRPNMLIVNEALRPGPQGQDRREVGGCKPEMPQRKSLESSPGRPLHHLIDGIIRDVCELPGYNSPEDQPELLQATCSELERILRNRLGVETAASPCDETGWLIEGQMEAMGQSYVGIVGGPHKNFAIVYDASRALRFSRREDAQAMVDNIAWFRNSTHQPLRVAEHLWQGMRPAVETAGEQS